MVIRYLIIGPSKGPVLNKLPLWKLEKVLLKRRILESGGDDDDHIRGEEALRASVVEVEEVVEAENLPLIISLQRLWKQCIFLFCPARRQGSSKEELMVKSASRRIV